MMDLFFLALLALVLCSVQFADNPDFIEKDQMQSIRGILAIVVVFCHIAHKNIAPSYVFKYLTLGGTLAVSVFFFFLDMAWREVSSINQTTVCISFEDE